MYDSLIVYVIRSIYRICYAHGLLCASLSFRLKQLKAVEKLVSLITNQPEEVCADREGGRGEGGRGEGGREGRGEGGIRDVMHV